MPGLSVRLRVLASTGKIAFGNFQIFSLNIRYSLNSTKWTKVLLHSNEKLDWFCWRKIFLNYLQLWKSLTIEKEY